MALLSLRPGRPRALHSSTRPWKCRPSSNLVQTAGAPSRGNPGKVNHVVLPVQLRFFNPCLKHNRRTYEDVCQKSFPLQTALIDWNWPRQAGHYRSLGPELAIQDKHRGMGGGFPLRLNAISGWCQLGYYVNSGVRPTQVYSQLRWRA